VAVAAVAVAGAGAGAGAGGGGAGGGGAGGSTPVTVNVGVPLRPVLPATSDCAAWAVYVPAASGGFASTEKAPPGARVVVRVCTGVPPGSVP
jgi:hypothetical protein